MGLFSRNIDYNLILENILDKKRFSTNTKSLLLSMIYKIETAYSDYCKVKRISKSKEKFLSEIINIISEYVELIKTVEPNSEDGKILKKYKVLAITNERERTILSYPTESALLYAISDIEPKFFYIENYIFKKQFQEMLVEGNNLNNLEVIEDFTGWSWNPKSMIEKNYLSNLVYQNLIMIFGIEFIDLCKKSQSIEYDIIKNLKKNYKDYYIKLTQVIYLKIKNKKVDIHLRKCISELSEFEDPRKKAKYKDEIELYKNLLNLDIDIETAIIELQLSFIKLLYKKYKEIKTREEFIDIIYLVRYYRNIFVSKNKAIKDYEILENHLKKLYRKIITLGTEKSYIKMISLNIKLNSEILINCFDSTSMEIENLRLKLDIYRKVFLIDVYENKIFERKFELPYKVDNPELTIRKNKIIKIFG